MPNQIGFAIQSKVMKLEVTRRYISWYFLVADIPLGYFLISLDIAAITADPAYAGDFRKMGVVPVSTPLENIIGIGLGLIFILLVLFIHSGFLLMIGYARYALRPPACQDGWSNRFWKYSASYNSLVLLGVSPFSLMMLIVGLGGPDITHFVFFIVSAFVIAVIPTMGIIFSQMCISSPTPEAV